jgi:hypothetical protein
MSLMRTCTKCFLQKPIEEFPWKYKALGKRHTVCKECYAKRSNEWYQDNKERQIENARQNRIGYRIAARNCVMEYLSTHPCSICGESDPRVLEFHHVGQKTNEVSRLIGRGSLEAVKKEIEQYVVVCANCHRRLTSDERGWYKGR